MQLPDRWNPRLWLRRMLLAFRRWLLKRTPSEQLADHADAVRMAEAFARHLMTRNEVRRLEDMPPDPPSSDAGKAPVS